jgi:hypothetical protein
VGWSQGKFPTLFQSYIKALAGSCLTIAHAFGAETGAETRLAHWSSPQFGVADTSGLEEKSRQCLRVRRKLASPRDVVSYEVRAALR